MLLAFPLDDPFSTASVDPALVPGELLQSGRVLLPKFFIRSSRFVEHATQFCHLLLELHGFLMGRQQKKVALGRVIGKVGVAIHREADDLQGEKGTSSIHHLRRCITPDSSR